MSAEEEISGSHEQWAYVRYRLDDTKSKVPISFIKDFNSTVTLDTTRLHKVFWSDVQGDTPEKLRRRLSGPIPLIESKEDGAFGEPGYYRATVYVVAKNLQDLEECIKKGRRMPEVPISLCTSSFDQQPASAKPGNSKNAGKPKSVSAPKKTKEGDSAPKKTGGSSAPKKTKEGDSAPKKTGGSSAPKKTKDGGSVANVDDIYKRILGGQSSSTQKTPAVPGTMNRKPVTMERKRTLSTESSESDDPSYVSPRKFKALQQELALKTQALFQSKATNEKLRKQIDFHDGESATDECDHQTSISGQATGKQGSTQPSASAGAVAVLSAGGSVTEKCHQKPPISGQVDDSGKQDAQRDVTTLAVSSPAAGSRTEMMEQGSSSGNGNLSSEEESFSSEIGNHSSENRNPNTEDNSEDEKEAEAVEPISSRSKRYRVTHSEKAARQKKKKTLLKYLTIPTEYNYDTPEKFVISQDYSIEAIDMMYLWSIPEGELHDLEFIKEAAVKVFTSAVLKASVAKGIKTTSLPGLNPVAREGIRVLLILRAQREGVEVTADTARTKETVVTSAINEKCKTLRRSEAK